MMISVDIPDALPQAVPSLRSAIVAESCGPTSYRLDDGRLAQRSLSCLLQAQTGDRVLVWGADEGACYILSVLERTTGQQSARLNVPGTEEVTLDAPRLSLQAESLLSLFSLQNLDLCASAGQLAAVASNINLMALQTLMQTASQGLGQYENLLLEAKGLARLHARQTLLSAQEDIRADAQRISMG